MERRRDGGGCSGEIHIRRATENEAREIAEIHVESLRTGYRGFLPTSYLDALSVDQYEESWRRQLRVLPAERRPWIAEIQGRAVAFVAAGPSRDDDAERYVAEVYDIFVDPDCWDRGIGRTLLKHVERDLRQRGYAEITLWCHAGNEKARAFYEKAGWKPDGTSKTHSMAGVETEEIRYRFPWD